jgi:hypothetical protein
MSINGFQYEFEFPTKNNLDIRDFNFDGVPDVYFIYDRAQNTSGILFLYDPKFGGMRYHNNYSNISAKTEKSILTSSGRSGPDDLRTTYFRIVDGRDSVIIWAEQINDSVFIYDKQITGKNNKLLLKIDKNENTLWEICDRYLNISSE